MTTLTIPTTVTDRYHETITRSMAFLDDYLGGPEWVNEIDLDALDLEDGSTCVCGQLFDVSTGRRTVDDMDDSDGYAYALKHVVEHGLPDDRTIRTGVSGEFDRTEAAEYLGFSVDKDWVWEAVAVGNGYEDEDAMWEDTTIDDRQIISPWPLFTQTWRERIEKRRAELGTL